MKQSSLIFVASILLLISIICVVHTTAVAGDYSITVSFDYETYNSMSYIRFSIDKPQNLPTRSDSISKLFDIQLPSVQTNILDLSPECTRPASTSDASPMFTYQAQSNIQRGYEIMYNSTFDRTSPQYQTELNCVIKIRAQPAVTGILSAGQPFNILLLSATNVFVLPESTTKTNRLPISFALPQTSAMLTTSTRLYSDSYPFIFAIDKFHNATDQLTRANAPTIPDVYATTVTIDVTLLKLRKNNKLILAHPFKFQFVAGLSFCTSPHELTPYDFKAQSPVSADSTIDTPVDGVAISLLSFSSNPRGISCQIAITPVLTDTATFPASQISLFLEYSFYNKTSTSSFSNFYKTFTQRSFQKLDAQTIFPAFDPATILATPAIATRSDVNLSPMFLHPTNLIFPFWNRYSIRVQTFAFEPNQILWVPAPDNLESGGFCLPFDAGPIKAADPSFAEESFAGPGGPIQIDRCAMKDAFESCPDFEFHVGQSGEGKIGLVLYPKKYLRFAASNCVNDFRWSVPVGGTIPTGPFSLQVHIVNKDQITPVSLTALPQVALLDTDWHVDVPYSLRQSPQVTLIDSKISNSPKIQLNQTLDDLTPDWSFKSPLVGGIISFHVNASATTPLSDGFRIEIVGPRLTSEGAVWVQRAWKDFKGRYNPSDITANYTSGAFCAQCFELTTELLPDHNGRNLLTSSDSPKLYYFPVLTYHGEDDIVSAQITLAYPGYQLPLDSSDLDAMATVYIYHVNSQISQQILIENPQFSINAQPSIFFTLSKARADVENVFNTISWWKASSAGAFQVNSLNANMSTQRMKLVSGDHEMDVQGLMSVQQTATVGITTTTDEWAIYEEGYMGLLLKNTQVRAGDTITLSEKITLQTNLTSTTNIIYCTGSVYQIDPVTSVWTSALDTDTAKTPLTNIPLLVISTTSNGVSGVFLRSLLSTQAMSCTSTVVPRLPADATELLDIPQIRYNSTLYSNRTSSGALYLVDFYLSKATSDAFSYPFTYELPVSIVNIVPNSRASLVVLGNPMKDQDKIFSGTYVTFQLTLQGIELLAGQSNAINIEFGTQRLQSTDDAYDTVALFSPKLICQNAEATISYRSSSTQVAVALSESYVATIQDPFICQFVMMVGIGAGSEEETFLISYLEEVILTSTFTYISSPYEATVAQSTQAGSLLFTLNQIGKMPLMFHQIIPFQSVDPVCVDASNKTIATIAFNQALSILIIYPEPELADSVSSIDKPIPNASCSFAAHKSFNAVSTTVRFRIGTSVPITENLTLPAISNLSDIGVDVLFSSITLYEDLEPTHGLFLDLFHYPLSQGDSILVNLPPGVNIGVSKYHFICDQRITLVSSFQPVNMTTILHLQIDSQISQYDEVYCALPIVLSAPVAQTTLTFATVVSGSIGTGQDNTTIWYTSKWPQVSSNYKVDTSYGLQWSQKNEQLQLVLEIEYTTLAFNVRSNRLLFDFSGMKSPSDPFNAQVAQYAGGDPNVNLNNPFSNHNSDTDTVDQNTNTSIQAGAAVISSNLNVVNCFLPYVDPFGIQHNDHRISAQYIRETGYKLIISLPAAPADKTTQVRCVIPIFIYNQQFSITPTILEFPTSKQYIATSSLPPLLVTTWYPSPSVEILDDLDKTPDPSPTNVQTVRTKLLGTTNPLLEKFLFPRFPSVLATSPHFFSAVSTATSFIGGNPDLHASALFSTLQIQSDSTSNQDLTQDIRFMEILFVQSRFFTNSELDDIIVIIHSLISKRDPLISLNSLIVLSQVRPPTINSDKYVLLRIGCAGLDVEGILLEAKFAGIDFSHLLSNNYEVIPYSFIDSHSVSDYRFDRTKVPIDCLRTSAAINQITQTCGAECGRPCPNTYQNGGQRVCRTDLDCESLNCDTSNWTCLDAPWTFVDLYTGVYSGYGTFTQQAVSLQAAFESIIALNPSKNPFQTDNTDTSEPPAVPFVSTS